MIALKMLLTVAGMLLPAIFHFSYAGKDAHLLAHEQRVLPRVSERRAVLGAEQRAACRRRRRAQLRRR